MSTPPPDDPEGDDRAGGDGSSAGARIDQVLAQVLGEPLLWPLVFVVLAHIAAFLAPALLLALRDGRVTAMAALALLAGLTVAAVHGELQRRGGFRALSALFAAAWALSGVAAIAAHRLGIF